MAGIEKDDRVVCRTPTLGKKGVTRIPRWKFESIRKVILASLMENRIPFAQLTDTVRNRLSTEELNNMGSLGWHVATVKLELEVRVEIRRLPQKGKQIIEIVE